MAFQRFNKQKGHYSLISNLNVGEYIVYENMSYRDIYHLIRYQKNKHNKKFEYLECINGVVLKRII